MKKLFESLGGRRTAVLVTALIAVGIFLLFAPHESSENDAAELSAPTSVQELSEYTAELEERITSLITSVDGIEYAKVLITLESGREVVFAENSSDEISSDRTSRTSNYLTLERSGDSEALPVTEICPKVRGVAVVCDRGSEPAVQSKLTELLSAALGITSNRIMISS